MHFPNNQPNTLSPATQSINPKLNRTRLARGEGGAGKLPAAGEREADELLLPLLLLLLMALLLHHHLFLLPLLSLARHLLLHFSPLLNVLLLQQIHLNQLLLSSLSLSLALFLFGFSREIGEQKREIGRGFGEERVLVVVVCVQQTAHVNIVTDLNICKSRPQIEPHHHLFTYLNLALSNFIISPTVPPIIRPATVVYYY